MDWLGLCGLGYFQDGKGSKMPSPRPQYGLTPITFTTTTGFPISAWEEERE